MSLRNERGEIIRETTAGEKYKLEDLIDSRQTEIKEMKASMHSLLMAEAFAIDEGEEERDVFYDKKIKRLETFPVSEKHKEESKVRIGTIGHIDLATIPSIVIHKAENQEYVFEIDDGLNMNFDSSERNRLMNKGYKIKRSFIDSSVYNKNGLMSHLAEQSEQENWYSVMIDILIQHFGEDKKNLKIKPETIMVGDNPGGRETVTLDPKKQK